MKPILKLIIAIMLILCLADMPYGFYELVRFAAAGAFVYLSYDYFKNKKRWTWVLICWISSFVSAIFQSCTRKGPLEYH